MIALIRLLIALGILKGLWEFIAGRRSILISKESDCQKEFLTFNSNLDIPKSKLSNLKRARRTIQQKLKEYFSEHPDFTIPRFATQGSFVNGTIIRTEQDLCDFDVGVYFFSKPKRTYETVQNHFKKALTGHTTAGITLKNKCVRLTYKGDFYIDMPIYYTLDKDSYYLGSKGNEWEKCDSKFFKDWVISHTSKVPQAIRIVRYFKAWADFHKTKNKVKMPSGLVFSIWSIQFYQPNKRDDVAFIHTSAKILKHLKDRFQFDWTCEMPVQPYDNVLSRLSKSQQTNFYQALKNMIQNGTEALRQANKQESLRIWGEIFGNRFPD